MVEEDEHPIPIKDGIVTTDENDQSGEIVNGEDREQIGFGIEVLESTEQNTHSGTVLTEEERELERSFIAELKNMTPSSMQHLEPRVKLPKIRLDDHTCKRGNKVLSQYLSEVDTIPEISDKVYAMGKVIASSLGVPTEVNIKGGKRKAKCEGQHRRERKLKEEIKELRHMVSRTNNELHRRKQRRKATSKEKVILKELRNKSRKDGTNSDLRNMKERWLDSVRYKKIKLQKCMEKRRRKQDNIMFQRDQKEFFRKLGEDGVHEGRMPNIVSFVEFLGRYMGKERKYTLHAMDGGDWRTTQRKGTQCYGVPSDF